jgi:hypothetical protein
MDISTPLKNADEKEFKFLFYVYDAFESHLRTAKSQQNEQNLNFLATFMSICIYKHIIT